MQFVKPKSVLQQQRRLKSVEKGDYGRSRCHDKYGKGISDIIYSKKYLLSLSMYIHRDQCFSSFLGDGESRRPVEKVWCGFMNLITLLVL